MAASLSENGWRLMLFVYATFSHLPQSLDGETAKTAIRTHAGHGRGVPGVETRQSQDVWDAEGSGLTWRLVRVSNGAYIVRLSNCPPHLTQVSHAGGVGGGGGL